MQCARIVLHTHGVCKPVHLLHTVPPTVAAAVIARALSRASFAFRCDSLRACMRFHFSLMRSTSACRHPTTPHRCSSARPRSSAPSRPPPPLLLLPLRVQSVLLRYRCDSFFFPPTPAVSSFRVVFPLAHPSSFVLFHPRSASPASASTPPPFELLDLEDDSTLRIVIPVVASKQVGVGGC
jgi:hypothetical protein